MSCTLNMQILPDTFDKNGDPLISFPLYLMVMVYTPGVIGINVTSHLSALSFRLKSVLVGPSILIEMSPLL